MTAYVNYVGFVISEEEDLASGPGPGFRHSELGVAEVLLQCKRAEVLLQCKRAEKASDIDILYP